VNYKYWLLRYVPDVVRGEAINVGVLVGRDGADWAVRRVSSFRRANRLGGDASLMTPWLKWLESAVDETTHPAFAGIGEQPLLAMTEASVQRLSVRLNNAVQIAQPRPVLADDAASAADFLFSELVLENEVHPRSTTRQRLLTGLRDQYQRVAQLSLGTSLRSQASAKVGRQSGRFDFAVVDGRVEQLSQVWSFDLRDIDRLEQDVRAWNYLVTRIRDEGAVLDENDDRAAVGADVPIASVFQLSEERRDSRREDVLGAAQEAWQRLGVEPVPSSRLEDVALRARALTL
jgi:hypothetical protein